MQGIVNVPTPDFTFDPSAPGACVAGVRPLRHGSYRLEAESASGKFVVHNYGHGGAGITLSWGCASKVRDIVQGHLVNSQDTDAAVIGAGVMGLTAATLLLDLGLTVTIYADRIPADTTSSKAGGQWAASEVRHTGKNQELGDILRTAYCTFRNSIGNGNIYGVYERPNYTPKRASNLDIVLQLAPGLIPDPIPLARLPFQGHTGGGFEYRTLLIEPPVFIPRLEADLRARNVSFVQRKFSSSDEILGSLTQNIIINCTGLGAMTLWDDDMMLPVKGQLAMLQPQPILQYLFSQDGYMFPRTDHVVIGGTFEEGVDDETPDPSVCRGLVRHMASVFGEAPAEALPRIHIDHPDNAWAVNPPLPRR
jgi:glycine/D-amino acid oxidase-like deaminating enzyme